MSERPLDAVGRIGQHLPGVLIAGVAAFGFLAAPNAQASITVGSPLTGPFFSTVTCGNASGCTWANTALGDSGANVTSPISGVVVRWRMAGDYGGTFKIRVLRPVGDSGEFTGVGTSTPVTIFGATTQAFSSNVPIEAGDLIGIDYGDGHHLSDASVTGSTIVQWAPALADGSTDPPSPFADNKELYFNADVEPDCDSDRLGDETQDTNLSTCAPGIIPIPAPSLPGGAPAPSLPGGVLATCRGLPATIVGTDGNDVRTGSQGRDVMLGLEGDDTLRGLAGNDVICGAKGNDALNGGKGKDTLLGQKGNDKLKGGPGKDKLSGKKGKDTLKGGGGNDKLKGDGGRDLCIGGKANDTASKCEVEKSI